jgi:hypothetical protein
VSPCRSNRDVREEHSTGSGNIEANALQVRVRPNVVRAILEDGEMRAGSFVSTTKARWCLRRPEMEIIMAKSKTLVAALSLAGATLAFSPAAVAQESLRQVYAAPVYVDCYYDIGKICGPAVAVGAYAALGPYGYGSSYAAVGVVGQPTTLWLGRGLRGGDWVAVHGSGGSR